MPTGYRSFLRKLVAGNSGRHGGTKPPELWEDVLRNSSSCWKKGALLLLVEAGSLTLESFGGVGTLGLQRRKIAFTLRGQCALDIFHLLLQGCFLFFFVLLCAPGDRPCHPWAPFLYLLASLPGRDGMERGEEGQGTNFHSFCLSVSWPCPSTEGRIEYSSIILILSGFQYMISDLAPSTVMMTTPKM